jgi:endonuclease-3
MDNQKCYDKLALMHPGARCELDFTTPFELLVAVVLSAQCTDKRVNLATKDLFVRYSTPEDYASLTVEELKPYIFPCGFYNNKARNIIAMAKAIVAEHGGRVPADMEKLTALPGVGRKTASVILSVAYGIPAIAVDTHVFRVAHRLGLSEGKTPDDVERDLRAAFPEEQWSRLHSMMVFHGRYICHAQKPDCARCLLRTDCPQYTNIIKEEK